MNCESYEGDNPQEPELVSIDGSFKAGRDGAKPGYWGGGQSPDGSGLLAGTSRISDRYGNHGIGEPIAYRSEVLVYQIKSSGTLYSA